MAQIPSMQDLLEAGVHFGHQVRRWHPKMAPYIFGPKDGVHIIDLEKTVEKLSEAINFLKQIKADGGKILFVGTKRQAAQIIKEEAKRVSMPFISQRWVGGLLTNFEEISKNINKLKDLEEKRQGNEFAELTKKERLLINRQIAKLERIYGGVKDLAGVPAAIFVVDVKREETACREAKHKGVPVVAICDTNANLDLVDYPIPGNDDAIKSVRILVKTLTESIGEGTKEPKEPKETKETNGTKAIKEPKAPKETKVAKAKKGTKAKK